MSSGPSPAKTITYRDLSPIGQAAHAWFRQLARALATSRLYRPDNPLVAQVRTKLHEPLVQSLDAGGAWNLRITPAEIYLLDEPVVQAAARTAEAETGGGKEAMLPFAFYRDGIRGLRFLPGLPQRDLDELFDALSVATAGPNTHDDLVTLMWQANTTHILMDTVPVEQTIYLSSRPGGGGGGGGGGVGGQSYAWSPAGGEMRTDIGLEAGASRGLHRDTFDDWPLPEDPVEVPAAYERLLPAMEFARMRLSTEWVGERSTDWTIQAPEVLREIATLSPEPATGALLAHAVSTWLASAVQRSSWSEAQEVLEILREFDPDGSLTNGELASAMAGLDTGLIAERLDQSETDDQARFFALAVAMGRPALDLACSVMAKATKSRTRAAACTMLCYLCHDQPDLLAPYLTDSRWYVARNAVFVLGQIGGPGVLRLLETAAHHPEPRVRRQVVSALGNVPRERRTGILVGQLDSRDPQVLAAALNMLTRERSPQVAEAILAQIQAPDFEARSEDNQRTLFAALAEVGDDSVVPPLEAMLHRGGWFARRTLQRSAAARALQRIGTPRALAALDAGLRARSEAVRSACLEAIQSRVAA